MKWTGLYGYMIKGDLIQDYGMGGDMGLLKGAKLSWTSNQTSGIIFSAMHSENSWYTSFFFLKGSIKGTLIIFNNCLEEKKNLLVKIVLPKQLQIYIIIP